MNIGIAMLAGAAFPDLLRVLANVFGVRDVTIALFSLLFLLLLDRLEVLHLGFGWFWPSLLAVAGAYLVASGLAAMVLCGSCSEEIAVSLITRCDSWTICLRIAGVSSLVGE